MTAIADYGRAYKLYNHAYRQEDGPEAEWYASLCPPEARTVLDIGCAEGMLLDALRVRGYEATGIDIDPRCPGAIRCDIESEVPAIGQFDIIYLNDVIEHFRNVPAALANIRELMHPTTFLIINTPNAAHFKRVLAYALGRREHPIGDLHLQLYDYWQLQQTLALCGLEIVNHIRRSERAIDHFFPLLGAKLTVVCWLCNPYQVEAML